MATRVGHPAPFPVELPQRLIELYTFRNDLVLDPFMGSGTTAVAAIRTQRSYLGFDTDKGYVERARERCRIERDQWESDERSRPLSHRVDLSGARGSIDADMSPQQRAVKEGRKAQEIARSVLEHCGYHITQTNVRTKSGVEIDFVVEDRGGVEWYVDVSGAFTTTRAGLRRTDTLWKSLGKAAVLKADGARQPILLLTTDLPVAGSAGDSALRKARDVEGAIIHDAIEMLSEAGQERLMRYADGKHFGRCEGELLPPERP
jgi:site-specific DNA-methyltransferase (adenine-specific)